MNRTKRIGKILQKHLSNFVIEIVDNSNLHKNHKGFDGTGETHIAIILKSINKKKINRLEIHKLINSLLKKEFDEGLHSLEINIIY